MSSSARAPLRLSSRHDQVGAEGYDPLGGAGQYDPQNGAEEYDPLHGAEQYGAEEYDPQRGAEGCPAVDAAAYSRDGLTEPDAASCSPLRPEPDSAPGKQRTSVFSGRLEAAGTQQQAAAAAATGAHASSTRSAAPAGKGLEQQGSGKPAAAADGAGRPSVLERLTFRQDANSQQQPDSRQPDAAGAAADAPQAHNAAGKPKYPPVQAPSPAQGDLRRASSSGQEHVLAGRLSTSPSQEGPGSGPLSRRHSASSAGERPGPARPHGFALRGLQSVGLLGGLARPRTLSLSKKPALAGPGSRAGRPGTANSNPSSSKADEAQPPAAPAAGSDAVVQEEQRTMSPAAGACGVSAATDAAAATAAEDGSVPTPSNIAQQLQQPIMARSAAPVPAAVKPELQPAAEPAADAPDAAAGAAPTAAAPPAAPVVQPAGIPGQVSDGGGTSSRKHQQQQQQQGAGKASRSRSLSRSHSSRSTKNRSRSSTSRSPSTHSSSRSRSRSRSRRRSTSSSSSEPSSRSHSRSPDRGRRPNVSARGRHRSRSTSMRRFQQPSSRSRSRCRGRDGGRSSSPRHQPQRRRSSRGRGRSRSPRHERGRRHISRSRSSSRWGGQQRRRSSSRLGGARRRERSRSSSRPRPILSDQLQRRLHSRSRSRSGIRGSDRQREQPRGSGDHPGWGRLSDGMKQRLGTGVSSSRREEKPRVPPFDAKPRRGGRSRSRSRSSSQDRGRDRTGHVKPEPAPAAGESAAAADAAASKADASKVRTADAGDVKPAASVDAGSSRDRPPSDQPGSSRDRPAQTHRDSSSREHSQAGNRSRERPPDRNPRYSSTASREGPHHSSRSPRRRSSRSSSSPHRQRSSSRDRGSRQRPTSPRRDHISRDTGPALGPRLSSRSDRREEVDRHDRRAGGRGREGQAGSPSQQRGPQDRRPATRRSRSPERPAGDRRQGSDWSWRGPERPAADRWRSPERSKRSPERSRRSPERAAEGQAGSVRQGRSPERQDRDIPRASAPSSGSGRDHPVQSELEGRPRHSSRSAPPSGDAPRVPEQLPPTSDTALHEQQDRARPGASAQQQQQPSTGRSGVQQPSSIGRLLELERQQQRELDRERERQRQQEQQQREQQREPELERRQQQAQVVQPLAAAHGGQRASAPSQPQEQQLRIVLPKRGPPPANAGLAAAAAAKQQQQQAAAVTDTSSMSASTVAAATPSPDAAAGPLAAPPISGLPSSKFLQNAVQQAAEMAAKGAVVCHTRCQQHLQQLLEAQAQLEAARAEVAALQQRWHDTWAIMHEQQQWTCREWMWRLADGQQDGPYTLAELKQYFSQGYMSGEVTSTLSGACMRLTKLLASPNMPADSSRTYLEQLQVQVAAAQDAERERVAQLLPLLDELRSSALPLAKANVRCLVTWYEAQTFALKFTLAGGRVEHRSHTVKQLQEKYTGVGRATLKNMMVSTGGVPPQAMSVAQVLSEYDSALQMEALLKAAPPPLPPARIFQDLPGFDDSTPAWLLLSPRQPLDPQHRLSIQQLRQEAGLEAGLVQGSSLVVHSSMRNRLVVVQDLLLLGQLVPEYGEGGGALDVYTANGPMQPQQQLAAGPAGAASAPVTLAGYYQQQHLQQNYQQQQQDEAAGGLGQPNPAQQPAQEMERQPSWRQQHMKQRQGPRGSRWEDAAPGSTAAHVHVGAPAAAAGSDDDMDMDGDDWVVASHLQGPAAAAAAAAAGAPGGDGQQQQGDGKRPPAHAEQQLPASKRARPQQDGRHQEPSLGRPAAAAAAAAAAELPEQATLTNIERHLGSIDVRLRARRLLRHWFPGCQQPRRPQPKSPLVHQREGPVSGAQQQQQQQAAVGSPLARHPTISWEAADGASPKQRTPSKQQQALHSVGAADGSPASIRQPLLRLTLHKMATAAAAGIDLTSGSPAAAGTGWDAGGSSSLGGASASPAPGSDSDAGAFSPQQQGRAARGTKPPRSSQQQQRRKSSDGAGGYMSGLDQETLDAIRAAQGLPVRRRAPQLLPPHAAEPVAGSKRSSPAPHVPRGRERAQGGSRQHPKPVEGGEADGGVSVAVLAAQQAELLSQLPPEEAEVFRNAMFGTRQHRLSRAAAAATSSEADSEPEADGSQPPPTAAAAAAARKHSKANSKQPVGAGARSSSVGGSSGSRTKHTARKQQQQQGRPGQLSCARCVPYPQVRQLLCKQPGWAHAFWVLDQQAAAVGSGNPWAPFTAGGAAAAGSSAVGAGPGLGTNGHPPPPGAVVATAAAAGAAGSATRRGAAADVGEGAGPAGGAAANSRGRRREAREVVRSAGGAGGEGEQLMDAAAWRRLVTQSKKVVFGRSGVHGWGLFAGEAIAEKGFVVEYVGQLIRPVLSDTRERAYEARGWDSSYLFRIDDEWVADATVQGGRARFINHSCDPNCESKIFSMDGTRKIGIYAKRAIQRGEELCYDYKFEYEEGERRVPCYCGAKNCRGFMN